jgi:hypothetical protein
LSAGQSGTDTVKRRPPGFHSRGPFQHQWENLYNMRSAVERVNSRIDDPFGFKKHYIRGFKKMQLRVGLALCVMLAMALGKIKENKAEQMRSLVKAA